ncbi:hypothetical protein JCM4814A_02380 [Streptomyces phaeofaciens JCM 4814]|uniref:Uncharacterized protein n=1 Tax=Streptomyces phaeofaciens TaxID=68254 RepID=A0A918HQ88_9ACTN|nr:hypothetical protein GCM10010226_83850 [Streptomyces phaeofaciens]
MTGAENAIGVADRPWVVSRLGIAEGTCSRGLAAPPNNSGTGLGNFAALNLTADCNRLRPPADLERPAP